jgi:GTP-binding protein
MNRFEELQAFGMTGGHNRSSSRSRGGRMSSSRSPRPSSSDRPGDDDVDDTTPPLPFGHRDTSRRKDIKTEIKILKSVGAIHNNDGHDFSQDQSAEKDSSTASAAAASTLFPRPSKYIPEIALMGRSNVGKSTLLNALLHGEVRPEPEEDLDNNIRHRRQRHTTNRKTTQTAKLPPGIKAVTSSRPGETRQITFYQLSSRQRRQKGHDNDGSNLEAFAPSDSEDCKDEKDNPGTATNNRKQQSTTSPISLMLVDLPGYGFAYGTGSGGSVSGKGTRGDDAGYYSSHDWQIPLIERFLLERVLPREIYGGGSSLSSPSSSLKRILLLLDARHGMKKSDVDFLNSLQDKIYCAASSDGGGNNRGKQHTIKKKVELPPIQIVLTKCDLVPQADLARRAVLVRCQLSEILRREAGSLPVMMVSAQMRGQAGLLELQRELAALVVHNNRKG